MGLRRRHSGREGGGALVSPGREPGGPQLDGTIRVTPRNRCRAQLRNRSRSSMAPLRQASGRGGRNGTATCAPEGDGQKRDIHKQEALRVPATRDACQAGGATWSVEVSRAGRRATAPSGPTGATCRPAPGAQAASRCGAGAAAGPGHGSCVAPVPRVGDGLAQDALAAPSDGVAVADQRLQAGRRGGGAASGWHAGKAHSGRRSSGTTGPATSQGPSRRLPQVPGQAGAVHAAGGSGQQGSRGSRAAGQQGQQGGQRARLHLLPFNVGQALCSVQQAAQHLGAGK